MSLVNTDRKNARRKEDVTSARSSFFSSSGGERVRLVVRGERGRARPASGQPGDTRTSTGSQKGPQQGACLTHHKRTQSRQQSTATGGNHEQGYGTARRPSQSTPQGHGHSQQGSYLVHRSDDRGARPRLLRSMSRPTALSEAAAPPLAPPAPVGPPSPTPPAQRRRGQCSRRPPPHPQLPRRPTLKRLWGARGHHHRPLAARLHPRFPWWEFHSRQRPASRPRRHHPPPPCRVRVPQGSWPPPCHRRSTRHLYRPQPTRPSCRKSRHPPQHPPLAATQLLPSVDCPPTQRPLSLPTNQRDAAVAQRAQLQSRPRQRPPPQRPQLPPRQRPLARRRRQPPQNVRPEKRR
ncbi:hypothetical protein I4F81_011918 [Pyropia yezoensis]|uniref:Uncharacterized protein n=1 Tax=Pyropia yezoensis TaxID=2788 RepID=A0ACC3CIA3_PYRYE|nr:hypothetical protein I4F81_011918 [Neopyropia yezoensis]